MLILSGNLLMHPDYPSQIYLLFRKKHKHYETPGGKVEANECLNPKKPTEKELMKTALRELLEEVSGIENIYSMKHFSDVKFSIPDGRKGVAHKFLTVADGNFQVGEPDIFDSKKSGIIKIQDLDKIKLSPDLVLIREKLKKLEDQT